MTLDVFQNLWPARFKRKEKSIAILQRLAPFKKYLLSDTNEMDINAQQKENPDIFAHFDELFFSHQTHVDKYNHQAWRNVLAKSVLPPEQHVFIDDKADHVQRAKELGIKGIVFESPEQLEEELRQLIRI